MTVDGLYGQNEPKNATSFTGGYLEGKGSKWDDMGEIFYFPGLILPADEYTVSGSFVPGIIVFTQFKMQSWTVFLRESLQN